MVVAVDGDCAQDGGPRLGSARGRSVMRPTDDDTSIPGQILGAAARTVGAMKAAAFEVYCQEANSYAIELRTYRAYDGSDPLTARETAEGLRRFVIPCLVEGK